MAASVEALSTSSTAQPSNFAREEWEDWMKWDGPFESLSSTTPQQSPPPLQFVSGSLGSTSPSEFDSLPPLNFSPVYALPTTESKKRKSAAIASNGNVPTGGSGRQPRGKKISHNVIEKRYRSNLNDKIARLRDSVPELRSAPPTIKRRPQKPVGSDSEGSGDEASQGLKFNKATVLVKATEYIQQLEKQNQRLLAEVSSLRNRGGPKHILQNPPVISTALPSSFVTPMTPISQTAESPSEKAKQLPQSQEASPVDLIAVPDNIRRVHNEAKTEAHCAPQPSSSAVEPAPVITPWSEVKGMIPLDESWQRFRAQARSQSHYAPEPPAPATPDFEDSVLDDDEGTSRWSRSRMMSRVLVGSLAGLMIMEGFSEREGDSKIEKRGLFSLPSELLTESRGFRVPIRKRIIAFAASDRARYTFPILGFSIMFLVLCLLAFVYSVPEPSKAIREGPCEKLEAEQSSEADSSTVSSAQSTTSLTLSASSPDQQSHETSSALELYATRIINWLGLSKFVPQSHDEEAADRSNSALRRERWLAYLRAIPKFGEDIQHGLAAL